MIANISLHIPTDNASYRLTGILHPHLDLNSHRDSLLSDSESNAGLSRNTLNRVPIC
jgi:hypothetical protein